MNPSKMAVAPEIKKLKAERNACILVHNYQEPEIHTVADFVGDSLELSRLAASTSADVIVFCGVHFMAETASILSPQKTVLLPVIDAGCPMADMVTAGELEKRKAELPGSAVVTYVNSTAAVKALSDVCCTSANAVKIVNSLENDDILFVPDQHLGSYVQAQTGKNFVYWPGYCPVHAMIMPDHILQRKKEYPEAVVVAHPECRLEVSSLADAVLSTSGMVRYCRENPAEQIIIATDAGMLYRLRQEAPGKTFIPALDRARCQNMQLITLEGVLASLQSMAPEVKVADDIRAEAYQAVSRMIELG